MEVNVPDRDELGRFVSWAKKKGGEAVDSIKRGAESSLRGVSSAASAAADAVGPIEAPDEAEDLEAPSVTKAKGMLNSMTETHEHVGPAKPRKQGAWSMEKKRGW